MSESLNQLDEVVRVGIAEGAVVRLGQRLRTTGLGSCVGLVLYDRLADVAGLVHIMLPTASNSVEAIPTKYVDLGVPWLVNEICRMGAHATRLKAKMAGGAQMFAFAGKSDIMRVGPRNVEAVTEALQRFAIPVVAADVGGNVGRTIEFDLHTERLYVRTAMRGEYCI